MWAFHPKTRARHRRQSSRASMMDDVSRTMSRETCFWYSKHVGHRWSLSWSKRPVVVAHHRSGEGEASRAVTRRCFSCHPSREGGRERQGEGERGALLLSERRRSRSWWDMGSSEVSSARLRRADGEGEQRRLSDMIVIGMVRVQWMW